MKRLIPLLFIMLAACKSEMPDIPDDVMPIDQMKVILADMHIADAVAETKALGGANEMILTEEYYLQIYKNNHVTEQEFVKSYNYYKTNPEWMNKLYDEVLNEVSKRTANVSK